MNRYARLRPFTNNVEMWRAFEEVMNEELLNLRLRLEKEQNEKTIYSLQGQIASIKICLNLRHLSNEPEARKTK